MEALLLRIQLDVLQEYNGECKTGWPLTPRPSSVSVSEFGAVGDGRTLNTIAFQNAIFYLKSFVDKGGAQLYVPEGRWFIGCINLTSHLTLFLEKDTVTLGSQDYSDWIVVGPMPSYGGDLEILPSIFALRTATLAWDMMQLLLKVVGTSMALHTAPTTKVHIREVLRTSSGSGIAFGSEMSGSILNILVESLHILPLIHPCGGCAPMSLAHLSMHHLNLVPNCKAHFTIHPPIVSSCTHIQLIKLQSCNRAWLNHKLFIH